MTALAAERETEQQLPGICSQYPQAAVKCWKGGMVMLNTSGYATPAADATAGRGVIGVAARTRAAPSNAGDNDIEVLTGVFKFNATSITQAMVGRVMYVVDDNTVDEDPGTYGIKAGILVKYESSTSGWVLISGKCPGVAVLSADADGSYSTGEQDLINEIKTVLNRYVL